MTQYEYEVNIDPLNVNKNGMDDWGAAFLWLDDERGVEYNLCYDNGECCSAIYKTECFEEDKYICTYYSIFEHYEIDFSDELWEEKLVTEMEHVAKKFWEVKT